MCSQLSPSSSPRASVSQLCPCQDPRAMRVDTQLQPTGQRGCVGRAASHTPAGLRDVCPGPATPAGAWGSGLPVSSGIGQPIQPSLLAPAPGPGSRPTTSTPWGPQPSPHDWGKAAASCLCQRLRFFLLSGGGMQRPRHPAPHHCTQLPQFHPAPPAPPCSPHSALLPQSTVLPVFAGPAVPRRNLIALFFGLHFAF